MDDWLVDTENWLDDTFELNNDKIYKPYKDQSGNEIIKNMNIDDALHFANYNYDFFEKPIKKNSDKEKITTINDNTDNTDNTKNTENSEVKTDKKKAKQKKKSNLHKSNLITNKSKDEVLDEYCDDYDDQYDEFYDKYQK